MTYQERAVAALERDVRCTYRHEFGGAAREHRILANGYVDIVWARGGDPLVTGPDSAPRAIWVEPGALFHGVRFRPGHAGAVLGVPAGDLVDGQVVLSDLWGGEITERMHDAPSDDLAWSILVGELARRAASARPDPIVVAAMASLTRTRHAALPRLAESLGISDRQLRRRFTSGVGFGPKTFHRIVRMRRFLALTGCRPPEDRALHELALEAGYADQAHLTREFTALAGLPPVAHLTDPRSWA